MHNPFATIQLCKMRLKGLSACENCISFHWNCFSAGVDNIRPLIDSFRELMAQPTLASIFSAPPKEKVHRGHFCPLRLVSESPFLDGCSAKAELLTLSPPPSYKWPPVNTILVQSYCSHKLLFLQHCPAQAAWITCRRIRAGVSRCIPMEQVEMGV